jgi:DNA topoisomerase-2
LGTSTAIEFKEYFANKKIVGFAHTGPVSDDCIDKVFNKKRPDDRKSWLEHYDKSAYLNTSQPQVSYEEFIDREMIHFSTYDCARSIPNMVDGLKTSLRKILYAAFKRRLTSEVKVAQFSGYVSEHSAYHHGEASLNGAIVKMAQNFVGSNNINLLEPNGQFGTRLQGGDDSASERYIFTLLNPLTRSIFPEADDAVLSFKDDDGTIVEPEFYVPIIPFALMNGISGIGTGFSCDVPSFNPMQMVEYLKTKLRGESYCGEFVPYYEGFKGLITKVDTNKYAIKGLYEKIGDDKVRIIELPVGTWTMPYITFLEGLLDGGVDKAGKKLAPVLKDMTNLSTEVNVDITVTFPKGKLAEMDDDAIVKLLKLATTVSTTNMHMFDAECKLHKYASVEEIIDAFYDVRLKTYQKRKDALIVAMRSLLVKLSNRARYILDVLSGAVDLRKKTNLQVTELLSGMKFDLIEGDYKYLIKMPMDSVTEEHVAKIVKEKADTERELEVLLATTLEQMWMKELDAFVGEYAGYKAKREKIQQGSPVVKSGTTKGAIKAKGK